ncbi:Thymus-specific serine protease [Podila clonocystis]|nr:Thymus-specific serine protease [Podila clonocystis]
MDWGMRARARNQIHWDKYWFQFEASRYDHDTKEEEGETSGKPHAGDSENDKRGSGCESMGTGGSHTYAPTSEDDDMGYFYFHQILNHFQEPSSALGGESEGRPPQVAFRQYYHVSSEFYKPGGPIILWIPGESPLHSLFLRRGLAYELANATSGLLVALEHRFYGNSIPRYQDSLTGGMYKHRSDFEMRTTRRKTRFHGQSDAMRAWLSTSRHHGIKSEPELSKLKAAPKIRTSEPSLADAQPTPTTSTGKEGLPLDMLKYLSVDQAIEDIAYFMDNFPKLQPAFFAQPKPEAQTSPVNAPKPNLRTNTTRWILTGCSYSGNLAAWTRQRYPNKVFAAFASSAPVRSALDFFEYTTSQTDILGKQCSSDLSLARDFLDSALQMTDKFMRHMALDAHGDDLSENKDNGTETFDGSPIQPLDGEVNNSTLPLSNKANDQHARQAAKLKVLSWFSPDFARDYALDGEEAHAAGWVWWTVASAVQYNTVVGPPSSPIGMVPRTTVDILCDTMALAHSSSPESSVSPIRYAKALATWFKDQQYFTPTKTEDLQPSDLDPNSVQNLAGIAWLWQTCSELGYLQTAQPSSCCCPSSSLPLAGASMMSYGANTFAGGSTALILGYSFRNLTTTCGWDDVAMFSGDGLSYPAVCKTLAPSRDQPVRMEGTVTTSQTSTCQPCQCYATNTAKDESVFSRLLTLEAAWQDCQLYFSNPKGGTGADSTASAASPQPGVSDDGSYGAKAIVDDNAHPSPLLTSSQSQSSSSSSSSLKQPCLLKGYPDVEHNVNQKFHGWEIAQDQDPLHTSSDNFLRLKKKQTQEDQHLLDDPVMTLIRQGQPSSNPLLQPSSQMHHSGRYYFTNGENDPWKELTLASAKAQEYLRINRVATSRRPRPVEQDPSGILSDSYLRSRTRTHHHRHRKPRHHHRRNRSDRHVLPQELVDRLPRPDRQPEVVEDANETNTEDESAAMAGDTQEREQNVIRIIPGASHCQDILYESTDRTSVALWTERQHVLKTFVRWIENDIQREKLEMRS